MVSVRLYQVICFKRHQEQNDGNNPSDNDIQVGIAFQLSIAIMQVNPQKATSQTTKRKTGIVNSLRVNWKWYFPHHTVFYFSKSAMYLRTNQRKPDIKIYS